jgi:tetratricopeptide (TPR) repeat protein
MSTPTPSSHLPRAYAALEAFPALHAEVSASLQRQAARAVACLGRATERPRLLAAVERAAADPRGGIVTIQGPPGSGVTSLIVALAARHAMPLWLADDDPAGLPALYAQIIALRRPGIALIDPALLTDPTAFARLLAEVAGQPGPPLTLLIDMPAPDVPPARPTPPLIPGDLPPGVTLIVGCAPGCALPEAPRLRLCLPDDDPDYETVAAGAMDAAGCDPATTARLIRASGGSLLYLDLAAAWLADGLIDPSAPPGGLAGLLDCWWQQLDSAGRRLAHLLAAAGEPLPLPIAAELLGTDPEPLLLRWESLRLIDLAVQAAPRDPDRVPGPPLLLATFAHSALRGLLAGGTYGDLEQAHGDLAALAMSQIADSALDAASLTGSYLVRQAARHAALGPPDKRAARLALVTARERVRGHERQASLDAAHRDAAWEMWAASAGPPLRSVRAAALAGTLATRARTLNGDSAVEALAAGFERGGREAALKRVIDLVERLPDGMGKAQILRRLGETCYGARMRSSAMRLLSRALDLEANPVSRGWREQREQLFVALAAAAIGRGDTVVALAIGERIEHLERRAMVETQVTRRLIAAGDLDRARRVARGILHESMGAWARAEVAVALTRAGDARGAMILEEITLETVVAWAQIELACDLAARDDRAARVRIDALPTPGQRDRGLARLAHALALAEKDGDALAAAEQIGAVETRVAALLDLRLTLDGLVAMLALERATNDIGGITGDDRAPLLASLAAAHAAIGRREDALRITEQLPEGEERDRALAKVAVAIAQSGDYLAAQAILVGLDDDDERDWAKDEIARILAAGGRWHESLALVAMIGADDQRARTAADLAIDRARSGDPLAALDQAAMIDAPTERARALTLVAPLLVAAGHIGAAMAVDGMFGLLASAEMRGRYLAAVAVALAEAGRYDDAASVIARILRPTDRARAGIALAQALAPSDRAGAESALGAALRSATIGREEALRALELTAPTLAVLGGGDLLAAAAATVDEVDRWM